MQPDDITAAITEVYDAFSFYGDANEPSEGERDVRQAVAEVIARLPKNVRDWVLHETSHVFIGGMTGTRGQHHKLYVPPRGESFEGMKVLRLILLNDDVQCGSDAEAWHTIAHEIAHSYRNDNTTSADIEEKTDAIAESWGFPTPPRRQEVVAGMRAEELQRGAP